MASDIYSFIPLNQELKITKLISLNYWKFPVNYVSEGEKHDFWELVYVDRGQLLVTAGEKKYILNAGEMIFHKPGEFHAIECIDGSPANAIVSAFVCNNKCMKYFEHRYSRLTERDREYLFEALRARPADFLSQSGYNGAIISQNYYDNDFGAKQMIRANLELLLITLIRKRSSPRIIGRVKSYSQLNNIRKITEQIITYLEEHIAEKLTLDQIANDLGYSVSQMEKHFRNQTGRGIIDTFIELKLYEARRLLGSGQMNISQVASYLNYSSSAYFSRLFKKKFNMTPSEYVRTFNN